VPVLDARRREIFAGVFAREGDWVRPVVEGAAATPDIWWERVLAHVDDPESPVYGGEGTPLLLGQGESLRPRLKAVGRPRLRPWVTAHPRTASALAAAMSVPGANVPTIHPFALTPEYMRVSDAEVKRHLDLTPGAPVDGIPNHDGGERSP